MTGIMIGGLDLSIWLGIASILYSIVTAHGVKVPILGDLLNVLLSGMTKNPVPLKLPVPVPGPGPIPSPAPDLGDGPLLSRHPLLKELIDLGLKQLLDKAAK